MGRSIIFGVMCELVSPEGVTYLIIGCSPMYIHAISPEGVTYLIIGCSPMYIRGQGGSPHLRDRRCPSQRYHALSGLFVQRDKPSKG